MDKRDPSTGQFLAGHVSNNLAERRAANAIYKTLRELATPEFIREQLMSLLNQGGQVQRQTMAMILDRIAPEVKQLAISTDGGAVQWNLTSLTQVEIDQLQGLALKTLQAPEVPLIDAEFEQVKTEAN